MTDSHALDDRPGHGRRHARPRRLGDAPGRGDRAGPGRPTAVDPAGVVLRRRRLGALRRDHPPARVLPDPGRALDPRGARRARSPRSPAPTPSSSSGSGTSEKTRLLLDALAAAGPLRRFVPVRRVRGDAARRGRRRSPPSVPASRSTPSSATSTATSAQVPRDGRRLVAFLGGTIGNLDPAQRARFLFDVDAMLDHGEAFLLGTDLVKDRGRLRRRLRRRRRRHRRVQPQRPRR